MAQLGSLNGWFDFLFQAPGGDEYWASQCPVSAASKAVEAQADDLDKTWHPTGFYTANEMQLMVGAIMDTANAQHNSVMAARASWDVAPLREAEENYNEIGKRALDYTEVWKAARSSGAVIDAPGFRGWVIDALRTINKGMLAVETAACFKPWWVSAMTVYMVYFEKAVAVAKQIGKIAVAAGQAVLDAADSLASFLPKVKWIALGVGVLFAGIFVTGHVRRLKYRLRLPDSPGGGM